MIMVLLPDSSAILLRHPKLSHFNPNGALGKEKDYRVSPVEVHLFVLKGSKAKDWHASLVFAEWVPSRNTMYFMPKHSLVPAWKGPRCVSRPRANRAGSPINTWAGPGWGRRRHGVIVSIRHNRLSEKAPFVAMPLLLVVRPGAPSSVLAPSSDARSP